MTVGPALAPFATHQINYGGMDLSYSIHVSPLNHHAVNKRASFCTKLNCTHPLL